MTDILVKVSKCTSRSLRDFREIYKTEDVRCSEPSLYLICHSTPHSASSPRSTLPLLICNKITPQMLSQDRKDGKP